MKRYNQYIQNEEIDFGKIFRKIWNNKLLIIFISLTFVVIGYIYWSLQPKIYKTEITVRYPPNFLLESYYPNIIPKKNIHEDFDNQFNLNLLSPDILFEFYEQYNEIGDFKNYLKEKKISFKDYFEGKIKIETNKKNIQNRYSLTYQEPLPGEQFLNDYIVFVKKKTDREFRENISQIIINEINIYAQNLEIAQKISLKDPLYVVVDDVKISNQADLFNKGTKVLSSQINFLNQYIKKAKDEELNYNPILLKASYSSLISKKLVIFLANSFVLGLFLSFIIIYFKSFLKLKKS